MDSPSYQEWYFNNRMLGTPVLILSAFATSAVGDTDDPEDLDDASSWREIDNSFNTSALKWLAENWTHTDELTIRLPGDIRVTSQIVFRRGTQFTLEPFTNNATFTIRNSTYNNQNDCALVFRDRCSLLNLLFKPNSFHNIIRIDAPANNGLSTIDSCDFETYGQGFFAITVARGNAELLSSNFSNAPGGIAVRFYNNTIGEAPNLTVISNNLFHIAKGSIGVVVGQPSSEDSASFDLGDITIDGCTMDIGGSLFSAEFSNNTRATAVGDLNINYCSLSDNIKAQTANDPDGTNFAIGITNTGANVSFNSINMIDNMLNINKGQSSLAAVFLPDTITANRLRMKGMFMVNDNSGNDLYPIVLNNSLLNGNASICGIVCNYQKSSQRGLGGIGKIVGNTIEPVSAADGNFNVAG